MQEFLDFTETTPSLIITDVNRYYLTGFRSSLGYLFCLKGKLILYVDGRYIEAAEKGVNKGVEVRLFKKLTTAFLDMSDEFHVNSFALEEEISVRELNSIRKFSKGSYADPKLSNLLCDMRAVKTEREVELIAKAQSTAEKAFEAVLNYIKPGVTERQVQLFLEYQMQLGGAEGMSFETIVVSGVNSSLPHGVPSDKPIQNGDFVTMDFGALYGGYCSDMTRTVAVGYATDEMQKVYEAVLLAQETAIAKVKARVDASKIDDAARTVIENAGYGKYFNHSTGHGVGIEIHEAPNLSPSSRQVLREGNIITCEPGIYIPQKFGVRIEDMLLVTEKGSKNLTKTQKNLIIIK